MTAKIDRHDPDVAVGVASLVFVLGKKSSGKSAFLQLFYPDQIVKFDPVFRNDQSKFLRKLHEFPAELTIAINTNLPSIRVQNDHFVRELQNVAQRKNHRYIVEWTMEESRWPVFLRSTYGLKIDSVIGIHEPYTEQPDNEVKTAHRFWAIANRLTEVQDTVYEYQVLKKDFEEPIEPLWYKYNIPDNS